MPTFTNKFELIRLYHYYSYMLVCITCTYLQLFTTQFIHKSISCFNNAIMYVKINTKMPNISNYINTSAFNRDIHQNLHKNYLKTGSGEQKRIQ